MNRICKVITEGLTEVTFDKDEYNLLGLSRAKEGDTDVVTLRAPLVQVIMDDSFGDLIDDTDSSGKKLVIGCIGTKTDDGNVTYYYPEFNPTKSTGKFVNKPSVSAGGSLVHLQLGDSLVHLQLGGFSNSLEKFNQIGGAMVVDESIKGEMKFLTQDEIEDLKRDMDSSVPASTKDPVPDPDPAPAPDVTGLEVTGLTPTITFDFTKSDIYDIISQKIIDGDASNALDIGKVIEQRSIKIGISSEDILNGIEYIEQLWRTKGNYTPVQIKLLMNATIEMLI